MRLQAFETSGSLQARFVSLVAAGNVNSGQLAIWGSDRLSASCSGGLTPIFASGRPPGRPHPGFGEENRSPAVLRRQATRRASVDCWLRYSPSPGVRGYGPADNGP